MKPFNLELAKAGHPVCTKDGRDVRIICFDRVDPQYPIIALIGGIVFEGIQSYTPDGLVTNEKTCDLDLVMKPIKKEGWINIYEKYGNSTSMTVYNTKDEAFVNRCPSNYVDTIKIEWEE